MNRYTSLRYRLLSLVLIPLVLLTGTVMLLASRWSSQYTYEQLFAKVNTDLRVAHDGFSGIEANGQRQLKALANSVQLADALSLGDTQRLNELTFIESELGDFDFLNLLTGNAQQIMDADGWRDYEFRDSSLSKQMLTARGMTNSSGIEIYTAEQWQQQPGLSAEVVTLPLLDTERAAPTTRLSEDRAMVIRTLQSVHDTMGNRIAILEAGLLLNRNFAFVDRIRDLVYGPGSLAPGSRGTVTVFLDDVRITTNVPLADDSRALGTRVSQEVRDAVLARGETWVNRAFVVDDWYISAYQPIVDVDRQRVGMLYAGYLEAPFRAELLKAIAALSALVLAGSLAAAAAAILGARSIFAPIETITAVVRATARGEHQRIGPMPTGNEIGELAFQFDAMLNNVDRHRKLIEHNALLLEEKVKQRTIELEEQNERLQDSIELLQQTRQQLANAEKLAALGELTAGVAHEINNPTAVILGNMDVLVAELGDRGEPLRTEIDLIIEQVYRIRSITDRLLQYSRSVQQKHQGQQTPFDQTDAPFAETSSINRLLQENQGSTYPGVVLDEVLDDTLKLLSHEFEGRQITVRKSCDATLCALIDRQEFQQVLINLISNAIQAIVNYGEITITVRDQSECHINLSVEDTGRGIEAEYLPRVFDPFFTAGKADGTGLGLSVSYGIVRRYGGDISVSSTIGRGSKFTLTLPGS
ncbi:MAG: cache domain-containing protein [Granulosicoccus sp.]